MLPNKDDIQVVDNISYSIHKHQINGPLKIINKSNNFYVFKVRTNQKKAITVEKTHGFISPHSYIELFLVLASNPSKEYEMKLEINYAIARAEDIDKNNSKMKNILENDILREIITIKRIEDNILQESNKQFESAQETQLTYRKGNIIQSSHVRINSHDQITEEKMEKSIEQSIIESGGYDFKSFMEEDGHSPIFKLKCSDMHTPLNLINADNGITGTDILNDIKQVVAADIQAQEFAHDIQAQNFANQIDNLISERQMKQTEDIFLRQTLLKGQMEDNQQFKVNLILPNQNHQSIETQNRYIEDTLLSLNTQIQCEKSFIKSLRNTSKNKSTQKYPTYLFLMLTICSFLLGVYLSREQIVK